MKNSEKFKTAKERVAAFNEYCYLHSCENCELDKYEYLDRAGLHSALPCACAMHWLELEYNEEAQNKEYKNEKDLETFFKFCESFSPCLETEENGNEK